MNYNEKQVLKHLQEKNNKRLQRHSENKSSIRRNKLQNTAKQITGLLGVFLILTIITNSMTWNILVEAHEEAPKQATHEVLVEETIEYKEEIKEEPVEIKNQYNKVFDNSVSFISDLEGFRENAYWDVKRWSIGFGTPSFKGETITKEEALQRKKEFVKPIFEIVDKDCYTNNQKIALTSYMYNVGKYAMNIHEYARNCDISSISYIMKVYGWTANGKPSVGLQKRRWIEINKFNTIG